MYCGASEMFLNPGSGDARGEDSYWSSIPFWMRSGMWFILIIFSVFWSVIRVVIFSRWFYIFIVLMRNGSLFHCSRDFNILECIFSPQEVWLETHWMVKGSWQIEGCPKWKLPFVFSVFSTSLYVYDAKNVKKSSKNKTNFIFCVLMPHMCHTGHCPEVSKCFFKEYFLN